MRDGARLDTVAMITLLGDANRRRLYELIVERSTPVGRDEAAAALGISRELAAFHLDRLMDGGLLEVEYRRLSGRSGPGAGRPAKLYRRARADIAASLPPRDYERAAQVFAAALAQLDRRAGVDATAVVSAAARQQGREVGREARRTGRPDGTAEGSLPALLRFAGFEPQVDPDDGVIRLRNCPYRLLSESQRELTCGMNLAWAAGVLDGLREPAFDVALEPEPDRCCVVFRPAPRGAGRSRPDVGGPPSGVSRRSRQGTG